MSNIRGWECDEVVSKMTQVPVHADTGTLSHPACTQSSRGLPANGARRVGLILSSDHDQIFQCHWQLGRQRSSPVAVCWRSSAVKSRKQRCGNQRVTSLKHTQRLPRIPCPVTSWCGGVDVVGKSPQSRPSRHAGRGSSPTKWWFPELKVVILGVTMSEPSCKVGAWQPNNDTVSQRPARTNQPRWHPPGSNLL